MITQRRERASGDVTIGCPYCQRNIPMVGYIEDAQIRSIELFVCPNCKRDFAAELRFDFSFNDAGSTGEDQP